MTPPVRNEAPAAAFERRCARAEALARTAADDEPLRFAAGLLRTQARIAAALAEEHAMRALSGRLGEDFARIREPLLEVARFATREGPEPLAREARAREREDADAAAMRLLAFWNGGRSSVEDYLSRAMLRPYLEHLRAQRLAPDRPRPRGRCPFCGGGPTVGALRGGAQGQGAARYFACALCGLEWAIGRILCGACGETDPVRLPSFSSSAHPGVRVDACQTCRRYVKTFDLSQDARPVPEVDDLTSIALDLWAAQQGFTRIEPGLAGL